VAIRIGTSGWSYPSWRPGFYPQATPTAGFLPFYAGRFDTVELNVTGYRLPSADQFARWADAVPDRFRFAPKLVLGNPGRLAAFLDRVTALGDRLGPVRVSPPPTLDAGGLAEGLARIAGRVEIALDAPAELRAGLEGVVAVNDLAAEPFRYVRMREPPYAEAALRELAAGLRDPAYVFFRHEDAPTAPAYAARLRELL
jgi:uncharacterized protein YecE (DUF72 family)